MFLGWSWTLQVLNVGPSRRLNDNATLFQSHYNFMGCHSVNVSLHLNVYSLQGRVRRNDNRPTFVSIPVEEIAERIFFLRNVAWRVSENDCSSFTHKRCVLLTWSGNKLILLGSPTCSKIYCKVIWITLSLKEPWQHSVSFALFIVLLVYATSYCNLGYSTSRRNEEVV